MVDKYGKRKFKLLNIRTREMRELKYINYILENIMNIVIDNKYGRKEKQTDTEFIDKCKKINDNLVNSYNKKSKKNVDNHIDNHTDDDSSDNEEVSMFFKKSIIKPKNKNN